MLKRIARRSRRLRFAVPLVALLAVLFAVEAGLMLVLDAAFPDRKAAWFTALLDAALLTIVASVGAWRFFVRPLQVALSSEAVHAQAVLAAASEAIITTDAQGAIIGFNPAAARLFGYERHEVLRKNISLLVHGNRGHRDARFVCSNADAVAARATADGWTEWFARRKDGTELPIEVNVTAVRLAGSARYTCFMRDIAERKRVEESTRLLAYHDMLTGLPNRVLFYDRLRQSVALAKRHKQRFAVLYIDLDGFKAVNDKWGHDAGDNVLKSGAQRVRSLLRETDTVARMGGDEFIVILARSGSRPAVARVARKIIKALGVPFPLPESGQEIAIGSSIGIAVYPDDGEDIDVLVKAADNAMYRAKRTGGTYWFSGHRDSAKQAPAARQKDQR